MAGLTRFLRRLVTVLPQEVLVALLRVLVLLLIFLALLVLWFVRFLALFAKRRDSLFEEERKEPCARIPEAVMRRPDPCIYSQKYLRGQGLPVTWNNPDIWIAPADDPTAVMPDSYNLSPETDYIVFVRVRNASATDAAIGTVVRLHYRPWSFNSPDLLPVHTDANGEEVYRIANVPPLGVSADGATVQFNWRTPPLAEGQQRRHFCLQASLRHPMDTNPANNMGQENTDVRAGPAGGQDRREAREAAAGQVRPGETVEVEVPLHNGADGERRFRFEADAFRIDPTGKVDLKLKVARGYARRSVVQRVANAVPTLHPSKPLRSTALAEDSEGGRFGFFLRRKLRLTKARYVGLDQVRERVLARDYRLPPGMTVTADGQPVGGDATIAVPAGTTHAVKLAVRLPDDAEAGAALPLNILAVRDDGVTIGGVTQIFRIGGRDGA